MKALAIIAASLVLSGCVTNGHLDVCKTAAERRLAYSSAIVAADLYADRGQPVPSAVRLGREAAVLALTVLNTNCPPPRL